MASAGKRVWSGGLAALTRFPWKRSEECAARLPGELSALVSVVTTVAGAAAAQSACRFGAKTRSRADPRAASGRSPGHRTPRGNAWPRRSHEGSDRRRESRERLGNRLDAARTRFPAGTSVSPSCGLTLGASHKDQPPRVRGNIGQSGSTVSRSRGSSSIPGSSPSGHATRPRLQLVRSGRTMPCVKQDGFERAR